YSFGGMALPAPAPVIVSAFVNPGDGSIELRWRPIPGELFATVGYFLGALFIQGVGLDMAVFPMGNVLPGETVLFPLYAEDFAGVLAQPATATVIAVAPIPGVPATAPTILSFQTTSTSITLLWTTVPGAEFYSVSRVGPSGAEFG